MNQYKERIKVLCERKGWDKIPIDTVWLLFTEEIGELASAIRQHRKVFPKRTSQDVVMEMGDVFSYLFQIANILDVDLDKMWELHDRKMNHHNYFTTVP
jgi:NTP pyrophosphatase (non-canonical NTP hydrolase)